MNSFTRRGERAYRTDVLTLASPGTASVLRMVHRLPQKPSDLADRCAPNVKPCPTANRRIRSASIYIMRSSCRFVRSIRNMRLTVATTLQDYSPCDVCPNRANASRRCHNGTWLRSPLAQGPPVPESQLPVGLRQDQVHLQASEFRGCFGVPCN